MVRTPGDIMRMFDINRNIVVPAVILVCNALIITIMRAGLIIVIVIIIAHRIIGITVIRITIRLTIHMRVARVIIVLMPITTVDVIISSCIIRVRCIIDVIVNNIHNIVILMRILKITNINA